MFMFYLVDGGGFEPLSFIMDLPKLLPVSVSYDYARPNELHHPYVVERAGVEPASWGYLASK